MNGGYGVKVYSLYSDNKHKINKLVESKNKNIRIIEFSLLKESNEIPPHFHPYGEDCAYVLKGELTYYIDTHSTVNLDKGNLAVGWTNLIHGYKNMSDSSVYFLVFATPEDNLTVYPEGNDLDIKHILLNRRVYNCLENDICIASPLSSFKTLVVDGIYQELEEKGVFKSFLDLEENILYTFETEKVELKTDKPKKFLKFSCKDALL